MGDFFNKDRKLRLRKWKMLEVVELDADDDDFESEVELREIEPKKKRRRTLQSRKKKVEADSSSTEVSVEREPLTPELDTVRVFFDCRSFIDIDSFIPYSAKKQVKTAVRDEMGNVAYHKEFYRSEMRCSWYGKMQVSRETRHYGKNGKFGFEVLCFEYSVAKWYEGTSGVNCGREPSAWLLLCPCLQAMKAMRIEVFSTLDFESIAKEFMQRAEIRRFDLSINFQVPPLYTPTDYINLLSRTILNRTAAKIEGEGSISFGTDKTSYRAIFYDKEKEQKKYYLTADKDPIMYYIDDRGTTQSVNVNEKKKEFYKLNEDYFKNKLRFEIQFRSKFMQDNNLETVGMEKIENVLRVGALYWREALDQFDEQLGRKNFDTQEGNDALSNVLADLDEKKDRGLVSRTVHANKSVFILDCFRKGWKFVAREMGTDLFSRNRKWVLQNLNYDVKVLNMLPIMRIMQPSLLLSKEGTMVRNFILQPAPVQHPRFGT